jgi:hypothetical protein
MAPKTDPNGTDDPAPSTPEPEEEELPNRAARRARGKKAAPPPPPGKVFPTGRRNPDHGRNWATRRSG